VSVRVEEAATTSKGAELATSESPMRATRKTMDAPASGVTESVATPSTSAPVVPG